MPAVPFGSTCTIAPAASTVSATGSVSYDTGVSLPATVPCEIQALSAGDPVNFERRVGRVAYRGWFPYGTAIGLNAAVTWKGKVLAVKSPPHDPTGVEDHLVCDLEGVV